MTGLVKKTSELLRIRCFSDVFTIFLYLFLLILEHFEYIYYVPIVLMGYPWFLWVTRSFLRVNHTLTQMGMLFAGAGTGVGNFTQGLPVSHLILGFVIGSDPEVTTNPVNFKQGERRCRS